MRILIVNDDGIGAAQLPALAKWCRKFGQVTIAVPTEERSAKSHSIEIHKAFQAKQVELEPGLMAWAVDAFPADCVRFAVLALHQDFDLVISGVNRGLNIGADILYSGTVSAALEAVNLGLRAIAISTPPKFYDQATAHLDRVFAYIAERELLDIHPIYNINIPGNPQKICITRQGGPYYSDDYHMLENHMCQPAGKPVWEDSFDDTLDTDATLHGHISITPLTVDKTDYAVYRQLTK